MQINKKTGTFPAALEKKPWRYLAATISSSFVLLFAISVTPPVFAQSEEASPHNPSSSVNAPVSPAWQAPGAPNGLSLSAAERVDARSSPLGPSSCEIALPEECRGAGLDAVECMAFYETRILSVRDILSRVLDQCGKNETGIVRPSDHELSPELMEKIAQLEEEIADLRAQLTEVKVERDALRQELTPSPQAAEVDSLSGDTGPSGNRSRALPLGGGDEEAGTDLDSDTEDLGARLLDYSSTPESFLELAFVCAAPAPSESDVRSALEKAPELFAGLSVIQRARIVRSLVDEMSAADVAREIWRSSVRQSHVVAKQTAAAYFCRELPRSCISASDRTRLCE